MNENKQFLGYRINIGYKNGLSLNTMNFDYKGQQLNISNIEEWTKDAIIARNDVMVAKLLELFAFDDNELKTLLVE